MSQEKTGKIGTRNLCTCQCQCRFLVSFHALQTAASIQLVLLRVLNPLDADDFQDTHTHTHTHLATCKTFALVLRLHDVMASAQASEMILVSLHSQARVQSIDYNVQWFTLQWLKLSTLLMRPKGQHSCPGLSCDPTGVSLFFFF